MRWSTFIAGALAAAVFFVVRNAFDLEDGAFVTALVAASVGAAAIPAMVALVIGRGVRSLVSHAVAAFLLVPVLYTAYLALFAVAVCGIAGKTCYS